MGFSELPVNAEIGIRTEKESADKPGSVVGDHSSGTTVTGRLKQPTRKSRSDTALQVALRLPYLALLPVGFAVPRMLPPARCALTAPFHPYLRHPCGRHVGGIFLLHFPWARAPQALPGTVSEGARTFLPISCEMQRSPGRLRWARYAPELITTTSAIEGMR